MDLRLSVIELVVADMAATLAFYRHLGLDLPADADEAPHVEAELPGGLRVAFDTEDTIRSINPDWRPPTGARMALAFQAPDPAGVDRAYAELTALGYSGHLEPWDAFWGQRYAAVLDPDGNSVDLFAPLPAG